MKKSNLKKFQELLIKRNIDLYIVPTSDFHNSEYVGDYFKCREYLSNFTGSAGTLVIGQKDAYIFVDGRYFVQVEKEVNSNEIKIMKLGEPNVPSLISFIVDHLKENQTLAFDGRCMNYQIISEIINLTSNKNIKIISNEDLVAKIWKNRPQIPCSPLYSLASFCGESSINKIKIIRNKMKDKNTTTHIISSLDDIAYILNLRGYDIPCNPVFLSYLIITLDEVILFIDNNKISKDIFEYLKDNNILIKDYDMFYNYLETIKNEKILLDTNIANYQIYSLISKSNSIISDTNPSLFMKSIKNEKEIENLRLCHIYDGLAMLDFMIFVKTIKENEKIYNEFDLGEYLNALRAKQDYFIENSFNPIIAYQENAAMMHYSAKNKGSKKIKGNGLLLVDSGGQYYLGTTDITRTLVIGKVNKLLKRHFTIALKSMFNLSNAKFLYGCNGHSLDILARGPIWDEGLDYKCGTGHGIGYCLNVHEAPNGFRYKKVVDRNDSGVLEIGMTTTDEPGIYIENSHGIRHENVLLTIKHSQVENDLFLQFETLTLCPFDLDGLDKSLLTKIDKERINNYHQMVYDKLSPYCNEIQLEYLTKFTQKI